MFAPGSGAGFIREIEEVIVKVEVVQGGLAEREAGALLVPLFADKGLTGALQSIDEKIGGMLSAFLAREDFRGKKNETAVLYPPPGAIGAERLVLVGLGERETCSAERVRQAAGAAAKAARALGATTLLAPPMGAERLAEEVAAQATVEGVLLGLYRFWELKTASKPTPDVVSLTLVAEGKDGAVGAGIGRVLAESANLARDLVNRPANVATPTHLAEVARAITEETGITVRVLDEAEMAALGMGALLSVAHGSDEPARFIVMDYRPEGDERSTVVLVGKGITFDSGGISLKPSKGMEAMKGDMGGAAAMMGAIRALALLKVPLRVVALVPATENMPSGRATKPGDVVEAMNGKTIEVINTDAEGRLILADALAYAERFHPDAIFDAATLTGACVVALGHHAAGVMGDEGLIERLREAGERSGERVWPLPLFEAYGEQLKSDVADLKNVGGRPAGAITAGYFLSHFVPEGVPWVHIDIAGVFMAERERPYQPKGGTGFGVRLLAETLRHWGEAD